MVEKGRKSLAGLLLYVSATAAVSTGSWIAALNMNAPPFFSIILLLTVLVLISLIVVVCIDLFGDNRTAAFEGVLVEKKGVVNGFRLRISPDGSEKLRSFNMNLKFTDSVDSLQLNDRIEIRYYKLTRVVIAVQEVSR